MKIAYYIISALLIAFYPRQLTNIICFGRNRDNPRITNKNIYWGIYLFWTIIYLIGCMMMGSAVDVDTPLDEVTCYFILVKDGRDCIEEGSIDNDEYYIARYCTLDEVNGDFLQNVLQKYEFAYQYFRPQRLTFHKQKEFWIIYANDDAVGYVKVKRKILLSNSFPISRTIGTD